MLTREDLLVLQSPFKPNEHEFLKGNAYITEGAITSRIEQVDPSWKLEQINLFNRADSKQVICTVRLTINDTWRDGVGMAVITMTKQGDNEANEAEKSAATDAFKRAARLFGVGRYLLDLPGSVVDVASMAKWFKESVGTPTPQPPIPQPPIAPPPEAQNNPFSGQSASAAPAPAENGANGVPSELAGIWNNPPSGAQWTLLRKWLFENVYESNKFKFDGSFAKRAKETNSWKRGDGSQMTVGNIVTFLQTRHDGEKAGLKETA